MPDKAEESPPVGGVSDADNTPPAESADTRQSASGDASYKPLSFGKKALAYARLLRLSNGPTAVADVWMGYAVASHSLEPTTPLALMTVASLCAYHGGIAMNDAVDADRDALDRRGRPIEQGIVTARFAWFLAMLLLGGCVTLASIASALPGRSGDPVIAVLLVGAIATYNSSLKSTIAGPLVMGFCRLMNVQLGIATAKSFNGAPPPLKGSLPEGAEEAWLASVVIGLYVVGVTLFAFDEANQVKRGLLFWGATISAIAFSLIGFWAPPAAAIQQGTWYLIWTIVALIATRGMFAAVLQPTPKNIGRGVGIAIQGLVVIDAVLAAIYAGPVAGLAILALLPVTMLLSHWIPQT